MYVVGSVILKLILEKLEGVIWTRFIWLGRESCGRFL
jgi:hypothetical protein